MSSFTTHADIMASLIADAQSQKGKTKPNPVTAAAVYKDGHCIATAVHEKAGGPHAEVLALRLAGEQARGATLYVNLEPCTHTGKTPPCTDAIIKAGISTVVYAMDDPNPAVRQKPAKSILERAGIAVIDGILSKEARYLNRVFIKNVTHHKPYITLKIGLSLDNKITLADGHPGMVTSEDSRRDVHRLRREADAILVGARTVLSDDPQLDVRYDLLTDGFHNPVKVVLDTRLEVPAHAKLFRKTPTSAPAIVATDINAIDLKSPSDSPNISYWGFSLTDAGTIGWDPLLNRCYDSGLYHVFIEGGPRLIASALRQGIVDEVIVYVAPIIMGSQAIDAFGLMDRKISFSTREVSAIGQDCRLLLEPA